MSKALPVKRPTQKDVARRAGVSQATVSMAVSGKFDQTLSEETLARIHSAAKELGYSPNRFAQALKTRRTMTVACIVPDITNPFYPELIRGVQKKARERDYDVITVGTEGSEEQERRFLEWARQGRVDGVVGVFFTLRAADLAGLLGAGVPVVRIESSRKAGGSLPLDNIYVDNTAAAAAVTEYLLSRGHRRIAMVAGKGGPQAVRVEGYRRALDRAGFNPEIIVDDAFNEEGGFRAAARILSAPKRKRPTAVFAANDLMAIGIMMAMREKGVDVPGETAVAGFDDILAARLSTPALSTVSQFQERMGERAVGLLLERLSGARAGDGLAVEMPYEFIRRGSA